jgi:hypothetical protein
MIFLLLHALRFGFGSILIIFGIIGIIVGAISMIDPVGTKASDDNDPFGIPPTIWESISITLFYTLLFLSGLWMIFPRHWKKTAKSASLRSFSPSDTRRHRSVGKE